MPPQGFFIGPVFIYFYGIILMLGAVAAAFLADSLDQASFRRTGFCGLLFPVLEDEILAARAASGEPPGAATADARPRWLSSRASSSTWRSPPRQPRSVVR